MNNILIVIIATQDYLPMGLRVINHFTNHYKGNAKLTFRVVSDIDPREYMPYANIEWVHMDAGLGFVAYTMRKIEEIQYVTDEYDYYLVIDADTVFKEDFGDELFHKDFMGLYHPLSHNLSSYSSAFEFRKSEAWFEKKPDFEGLEYWHACFIGGTYKEMKALSDHILKWWEIDQSNNFIPVWHDESYLNRYTNTIRKPDYTWEPYEAPFVTGQKGIPNFIAGKVAKDQIMSEPKEEILNKIKAHGPGKWDLMFGKFHVYPNFL